MAQNGEKALGAVAAVVREMDEAAMRTEVILHEQISGEQSLELEEEACAICPDLIPIMKQLDEKVALSEAQRWWRAWTRGPCAPRRMLLAVQQQRPSKNATRRTTGTSPSHRPPYNGGRQGNIQMDSLYLI
jgi:hypothetical protein